MKKSFRLFTLILAVLFLLPTMAQTAFAIPAEGGSPLLLSGSASGELSTVSLSVGSDFTVNVYATAEGVTDPGLRVTKEGESPRLLTGESLGAGEYLFRFDGRSPQCLGDTLTLELLSGETVLDTENFTVTGYLSKLLSESAAELSYTEAATAKLKTLIADILVYGGAAQIFTDHKTDALVSETELPAGVSASLFEILTAEDSVKSAQSFADGYAFASANLVFADKNYLTFRFNASSLDGLTVSANVKGKKKNLAIEKITEGEYRVTTDALTAKDFENVYVIDLVRNDTVLATCTYSVNSYVYSMQKSANTAMRELAKATCLYGKSAVDFDGELNGREEAPAETTTNFYISPGVLETWIDTPLVMDICTRLSGYDYHADRTLATKGYTVTWHSLNPAVAEISENGTVTGKALGATKIYAVLHGTGTDANVTDGDVLKAVTVRIVDKFSFVKSYEADPANQMITLPKTETARIRLSDYTSLPAGEYGSANIALFQGDRTGVFTMTCDDNLMSDFANWNTLSATYGVPVTFMAPTRTYLETGVTWHEQVLSGQTVQSHGHYHVSSDEYQSSPGTAFVWMDFYLGAKDITAAGAAPSRIIGYPCGFNRRDISSLIYIGGRGTGGYINDIATVDYNCTGSYSGFPSDAAQTFTHMEGQWLSVHYHSMGGDYDKLGNLFSILHDNSDTVWSTTFVKAAQYGQERDTATLDVTSATENRITFTLTDRMNDALYDCPLTVKILADDTWTAVRAYQNGKEIDAKVVNKGGFVYLFVDAVPDAGEVTVCRSTVSGISASADRIAFTPADAAGAIGEPMTVKFTVNKDTFAFPYATQNGKVLKTALTSEAGVTTLSVTAFVGEGEVVAVPVTHQFDAQEQYTMTEIAAGTVMPTAAKVITISTPKELCLLSEYVNKLHTCEGLTFILTCDLDMSGIPNFDPIGWELRYEKSSANYYFHPFMGTFDGQGHTVSGLFVERVMCNAGLFGYAENATIRNLTVKGNVYGIKRVGGIVGQTKNCTIDNVSFIGDVNNIARDGNENSGCYTGGIIGEAIGTLITNVSVNGNVLSVGGTKYSPYNRGDESGNHLGMYTGGILGYSSAGNDATTEINNAVFSGNVISRVPEGAIGGSDVGGIVGGAGGYKLLNCYANGTVRGTEYVGGIAGDSTSNSGNRFASITNCSFIGEITGTENVGGISGASHVNRNAKISYCYADAIIHTPADAECVGLIVGYVDKGGNDPRPENNYYNPTHNPTLPVAITKNGTTVGTNTPITDPAEALTALNTAASKNGYAAWALVDGKLFSAHFPIYTVTFKDKDGNVLTEKKIGNGLSVTAPEPPVYEGFEFSGWSESLTAITSDTVIQALYNSVNVYTVTFKGKDDAVIATVRVNEGKAATAPDAPLISGFFFENWDADFSSVTSDMTVKAVYSPAFTVSFYADSVLIAAVPTKAGQTAVAPAAPVKEGYRFTGWDKSIENVTSDFSVNAVYKATVAGPLEINVAQIKLKQASATNAATGDAKYCIPGASLETLVSTMSSTDVILYEGARARTLPASITGWELLSFTTTRNGTGGMGFNVFYNTEKYEYDSTCTTYSTIVLSSTDAGMLAVSLIHKDSGKKIVFASVYFGNNTKLDDTNIKKNLTAAVNSIAETFPDADAVILGLHSETGKTDSAGNRLDVAYGEHIASLDDAAAYLEGYDVTLLAQTDNGTTGDYLFAIELAATDVAISGSAADLSSLSGIADNSIGVTATLTISDAD
ncbi:MAG: InlB B-repeat-containing protein [Clostridia bacterium]|nr:InlB B-repeat-containing protein [Clostridia bacterium]